MKNLTTLLLVLLGSISILKANSEPSTYFNIYVLSANEQHDETVALIVTAIYDNTIINIIDDYEEGEEDNSYAGVLMAGQSHVHYVKDNASKKCILNSAYTAKSKGDHFTITSNQLIYTSKSTQQDWQYDYVPTQVKSSVGKRFMVFASPETASISDLNVFAYDDNTIVTVKSISNANITQKNEGTLHSNHDTVLIERTLNTGEDLIQFYQDGRNLMKSGNLYLIEASKPVSVQHGALQDVNENGGNYVPSSNGSLAGELFYFTMPELHKFEKQIRIVSWEKNTKVTLERFSNGAWQLVGNYKLGELVSTEFKSCDNSANEACTYRISTARGKKVSVFIDQPMTFAKGW